MNKYPIEFPYPPSPEQRDIFDFMLAGGDVSLVVQATAGAGKSATLVNVAQLLIATGFPANEILFVAFNKAIVNELQAKLPSGTRASTMHSFGMQILKDHLGDLKVENFKYSNIIRDLLKDEGITPRHHKDFRVISDAVKDLTNTMRLSLFPFEEASKEELLNLLEDTQDEYPKAYAGLICEVARAALTKGIKLAERRGEIDFTDMLYLPWKFDLTPKQQYALVLCDEAQDTNELQRWLQLKARKAGGRMLVCGDKFQAIYQFAGASPDGMGLMREKLGADELPLSVTWRCPRRHVELAQAVIGAQSIQAAPSAREGVIGEISQQAFETQIREGDAVMARTNRPLIEQAFAFIKAGKRAKIRGRDIGQGLIRTAESIIKEHCARDFDLAGFLAGLTVYRTEKAEAIYCRRDLNDEQIAQKVAEVGDRCDVLALIAENSGAVTPADLTGAIDRLFDDSLGDFILLTTVHKAKGLEFDRAYIIDPGNLPAKFAKSPADRQGELCVLFVALTRAKKELYFVDGLPNHAGVQAVVEKYAQKESAA